MNRRIVLLPLLVLVAFTPSPAHAQSPTPFQMLVSDGPTTSLIDSTGRLLGALPIPTGTDGAWPVAATDDGTRLLVTTLGGPSTTWVYDVATGASQPLLTGTIQTLKWMPGSTSQFLHADTFGGLSLYDIGTGTSVPWQAPSTLHPFARNWYRQGLDWDATHRSAVFQAGIYGGGGDGIFLGTLCEADPAQHICDLRPISLHGDGSWDQASYYPLMTRDGGTVFFSRRDSREWRLLRYDVATGVESTLMQLTGDYPATFIFPMALHADSDLVVAAPSTLFPGKRGLFRCTLEPFSCDEVYQARVGLASVTLVDGFVGSVSLARPLVPGCARTSGTVVLASPAPAGGLVVSLRSDNPNVVTPASVTLPTGTTVKRFPIVTRAVATTETAVIAADVIGHVATAVLTLRPMGPQSVSVTPNLVVGGAPAGGVVTLECPAGPGDIHVTLSSSKPGVAAPTTATITVPAGTWTGAFGVTTTPVPTITKVAIRAKANGVTKGKTLVVTPAR